MAEEEQLQAFLAETSLYNRIVLGHLLPLTRWDLLPLILQSWLRNFIAGTLVYFISGFLCCFFSYFWKHNVFVPIDSIPRRKAMVLQIYVSMKAMPWYSAVPTISEYMIEKGWTKCYSAIGDVGFPLYILHLFFYLVIVEIGIYLVHRELHDIKPLYKYLHAPHHIYNKQNSLSPFGGLALHPLDGILQAVPHVIALFVLPTHFRSHVMLLFADGVWTISIHDCIHSKTWPVMGAGYHTIHHTTNKHNYGHCTIIVDWLLGTLLHPSDDDDSNEKQM